MQVKEKEEKEEERKVVRVTFFVSSLHLHGESIVETISIDETNRLVNHALHAYRFARYSVPYLIKGPHTTCRIGSGRGSGRGRGLL